MNTDDVFKIAGAILGSVGGAALIVVGLSSWLGKVWANHILEKDRLKYASELERIKTQLQRESEKQKITFSLYFEGQFKLYNDLWLSLSELKNEVDRLWESATHSNLKSFVKAVQQAKRHIRNSAILIEREHYNQIINSLSAFDAYRIGKENLINGITVDRMAEHEIIELIDHNRECRQKIDDFTDSILEIMRMQISGRN
jgi:hypothetical protein